MLFKMKDLADDMNPGDVCLLTGVQMRSLVHEDATMQELTKELSPLGIKFDYISSLRYYRLVKNPEAQDAL